jgi:hypothetical protein
MSQSEQTKFLNTISTDYDAVNRMIAAVDVAKSESTSDDDKNKIFEVVRSSVGFNGINGMIFEQLREWVVRTVEKAIQEETQEENIWSLKEGLASVYRTHGKYNEANSLYMECLERIKLNLLENFSKVLSTRQILAEMFVNQGKFDRAE